LGRRMEGKGNVDGKTVYLATREKENIRGEVEEGQCYNLGSMGKE